MQLWGITIVVSPFGVSRVTNMFHSCDKSYQSQPGNAIYLEGTTSQCTSKSRN